MGKVFVAESFVAASFSPNYPKESMRFINLLQWKNLHPKFQKDGELTQIVLPVLEQKCFRTLQAGSPATFGNCPENERHLVKTENRPSWWN